MAGNLTEGTGTRQAMRSLVLNIVKRIKARFLSPWNPLGDGEGGLSSFSSWTGSLGSGGNLNLDNSFLGLGDKQEMEPKLLPKNMVKSEYNIRWITLSTGTRLGIK